MGEDVLEMTLKTEPGPPLDTASFVATFVSGEQFDLGKWQETDSVDRMEYAAIFLYGNGGSDKKLKKVVEKLANPLRVIKTKPKELDQAEREYQEYIKNEYRYATGKERKSGEVAALALDRVRRMAFDFNLTNNKYLRNELLEQLVRETQKDKEKVPETVTSEAKPEPVFFSEEEEPEIPPEIYRENLRRRMEDIDRLIRKPVEPGSVSPAIIDVDLQFLHQDFEKYIQSLKRTDSNFTGAFEEAERADNLARALVAKIGGRAKERPNTDTYLGMKAERFFAFPAEGRTTSDPIHDVITSATGIESLKKARKRWEKEAVSTTPITASYTKAGGKNGVRKILSEIGSDLTEVSLVPRYIEAAQGVVADRELSVQEALLISESILKGRLVLGLIDAASYVRDIKVPRGSPSEKEETKWKNDATAYLLAYSVSVIDDVLKE